MLGSRERRAERMAQSYRNQAVKDCHAAKSGQQWMAQLASQSSYIWKGKMHQWEKEDTIK